MKVEALEAECTDEDVIQNNCCVILFRHRYNKAKGN